MNRTKLLILAGFFLLVATQMFAGSNEKGIDYYRAELYDAAKIFFLSQKNQSQAEQAENDYYLGQTYFQLNQEDSASYYYQKAIEVFPEYPFGYIGAGKLELKKGNAKAADDLFKKANGFAKKDPSIQTTIAEVYVNIGDYTNAQLALDKARKIDNKYSGIYLVEGDMLMKQGKVGDACARYDNAILFNNTDKVAHLKLAQVYKDINTTVALQDLDKLVALDPNYIPAYAVYGDIYREKGQYIDALNAYEKFIAIPGVPMLQQERYAQLLFFTEQYPKALEQIQYVLSKDPNNLVMKRLQAYNNYRLENYDTGLEQMTEFLKEMPKDRHIYQDYLTLGKLALKEKQPEVALDAFQKAIEMDSTKVDIYKEAASAALNSGLYPEAINYYEKCLALDPSTDASDYYNYGRACMSAAAYYIDPANEASATTPDALAAYEAAFKGYVQKGDAAFAEVAKRKPDVPYGYMGRANINSLLDKYDADKTGKVAGYAKPLFEEAIPVLLNINADGSRNNDILTAYRYMVSYYASVSDTPNVIEYSKKILDIVPTDEVARKTLTLLKIKY
ncbi:MAG: tetratricopeptide repeat protein [Candidatus Azobacteroides sp.]|nr:tetratricopeptide repeat protein [Candidatus Azobacteroides sp.]